MRWIAPALFVYICAGGSWWMGEGGGWGWEDATVRQRAIGRAGRDFNLGSAPTGQQQQPAARAGSERVVQGLASGTGATYCRYK